MKTVNAYQAGCGKESKAGGLCWESWAIAYQQVDSTETKSLNGWRSLGPVIEEFMLILIPLDREELIWFQLKVTSECGRLSEKSSLRYPDFLNFQSNHQHFWRKQKKTSKWGRGQGKYQYKFHSPVIPWQYPPQQMLSILSPVKIPRISLNPPALVSSSVNTSLQNRILIYFSRILIDMCFWPTLVIFE